MATKTENLRLTLPGAGEFKDNWHVPTNGNFTIIDERVGEIENELVEAHPGEESLRDWLLVGHESDGALKATDEVAAARTSKVYDNQSSLSERFELSDLEIWRAREGQATLRDLHALRAMPFRSMILSGLQTGDGYPNWMSHSGGNVTVSGVGTPLYTYIDGKLARVRKGQTLAITGSEGVKYVYASFNADGVVTVDESATTDGVASSDGTHNIYFTHSGRDWSLYDVAAGDILTIPGGANQGSYVIKEVGAGANSDRLTIYGEFPSALASQSYTITDPLAVTLGFDTAETPATGKLYIAEADLDDAVQVTATRPRHFKDVFVSEWVAADTADNAGVIEHTFHHRLGSNKLDVSIQMSQAGDDSLHVMEGAIGSLVSTLSATVPTSQAVMIDSVDTGDLTTALSVTLAGAVAPTGSFIAKWDKNTVTIKNAVTGKFYMEYDGSVKTTGFYRVIVRKRA